MLVAMLADEHSRVCQLQCGLHDISS